MTSASLRLLSRIPAYRERLSLILTDSVDRALAGLEEIQPELTGNLKNDVLKSVAWIERGNLLEPDFSIELERRSTNDFQWWPLAARINALCNVDRENTGRQRMSVQSVPFVMPGELHPLQVEVLAIGDRVLHVLHVDWSRKLAQFTCQALRLDCQFLGLWFEPLLDVLPEKMLRTALKKQRNARRVVAGSYGLAAYYAHKIGLDPKPFLDRGGETDQFLYDVGSQSIC